MSKLTQAEMDAIRERAEKATPGEWSTYGKAVMAYGQLNWPPGRYGYVIRSMPDCPPDDPQALADAEFIAAARTDVPRLLDFVDTLLSVVRELTADEDAGMIGIGQETGCIICGKQVWGKGVKFEHYDTCPIVRGRALVGETKPTPPAPAPQEDARE